MDIHVTDMHQFACCRQRWLFSSPHGLSLRPNLPPESLFLGSLFHKAVEVWHRCLAAGIEPKLAESSALQTVESEADEVFDSAPFQYSASHHPTSYYADAVELCTRMLENWFLWAPGRWKVLPDWIERPIAVRIPTPKGYASRGLLVGKPDALVLYKGGVWIFELKTAKRRYGKSTMLDIDLQMGAYLWMLRKLGMTVKGILRVTAFKTVPSAPQITSKGAISRRKITTTYELLMRTIKENGLSPLDYQDWLGALKEAEHPCFQVQMFQRTQTELKLIERRLYDVYRQMARPVIYPSEAPQCTWCAYEDLCRYANQGVDYQFLIEEEFHEHARD